MTGNSSPEITIIIPTLNRSRVLHAALRTAVMQDYEPLTIIVSDNCSDDDTRDVVASFDDPRIHYIRPDRRLGMSLHWEFALSHVDGGWVTILGDDDGLLPDAAASVSALVKETEPFAIISPPCKYIWPNYKDNNYGLIISSNPKSGVIIDNRRKSLYDLLNTNNHVKDIPMLYTGNFVKNDLIKKIKYKFGRFYHSINPDIFSGLLLMFNDAKIVSIKSPLGIEGRSSYSYGMAFDRGLREGRDPKIIKRMRDFLEIENIPIHQDIPEGEDGGILPLVPVYIYESLLQLVDLGILGSEYRNHDLVLRVVLEKAMNEKNPIARKKILDWADAFARQHGLGIPANCEVTRMAPIARMLSTLEKLRAKHRKWKLRGSSMLPLRDVHEASLIVASKLQEMIGSRF